jgi:hypothetical protein
MSKFKLEFTWFFTVEGGLHLPTHPVATSPSIVYEIILQASAVWISVDYIVQAHVSSRMQLI